MDIISEWLIEGYGAIISTKLTLFTKIMVVQSVSMALD